jgi:hypothetical protein
MRDEKYNIMGGGGGNSFEPDDHKFFLRNNLIKKILTLKNLEIVYLNKTHDF